MRTRKPYSILVVIFVCLLVVGCNAPLTQAQEANSLSEAIGAQRLQVTIRGQSSVFTEPMLVMEVQNRTGRPVRVNIPAGSIFKSSQGNYCDVTVLPLEINLSESVSAPVTYRLYAYCLDVVGDVKTFPAPEAAYSPSSDLASEKVVAVLKSIKSSRGSESFAAQVAIWSAHKNQDVAQIEQDLGRDLSSYQGLVDQYLGVVRSSSTLQASPTGAVLPLSSAATGAPSGVTFAAAGVALLLALVGLVVIFKPWQFQSVHLRRRTANPSRPKREFVLAQASSDRAHRQALPPGSQRAISNARLSRPAAPPSSLGPGGGSDAGISAVPQPGAPAARNEAGLATLAQNQLVAVAHQNAPMGGAQEMPGNMPAGQATLAGMADGKPQPPAYSQGAGPDRLTLCIWQDGGQQTQCNLNGLEGIVSRGKAGQVLVQDPKVSAPHAILDISHPQGGPDRIRDLASKNGTWWNGSRLYPNEWTDLNDGDILVFGRTKMRYNKARCELVYEDETRQCVSLRGNNRWLVTRRQIPFVEFDSSDTSISVPHLYVRLINGRLEVRDLSSGNGVLVQGNRIKGREPIFDEDVIQIGRDTRIQVITNISNIPDEIGDWKRLNRIGGGGMADVYRVQHKQNKSILALKVPRPSIYRKMGQLGKKYRKLFENEMALARQIQHPNLVEARELGDLPDSRLPYLMMDYIDGPSVGLIIEKLGALSVPDVAEIATQVGMALNTLHVQHHYVHCDVKPSNIMIDNRGRVFLTDLGIATPCGEPLPGLGVPEYLPPEALHKAPVGPDTDIFSMGQTMLQMLAGQRLPSSIVQPGSQAELPATSDLNPSTTTPNRLLRELARTTGGVHREFTHIIKRCVAKKREKRYNQVSELLDAIEPFRGGADLRTLVARAGWKSSALQE